MNSAHSPVLIVGAGPAGLAAAIALASRGVSTALVERRLEPSPLPRATTISTRSMELLRGWGVEDAVLAGGVDVEWLMWEVPTLAQADAGTGIEVGLPSRGEAALISPTAPACVPQDHLEQVLRDHARSLGVRIELGATVIDLDNRPDDVRVTVRDTAGRTRQLTAGYVVAADGAHSPMRTALGIAMQGGQQVFAGNNALIRAPLWSLVGEHRYGIYVTTRAGAEGVFLPAGPGDRWGFGQLAGVGAGAPAVPSEEQLLDRIRLAAGIPALPVRIERTGSFTAAAQIAQRFREGRTFLVGDAAHRVTPRGGTGMNTAIKGGYDLGWKLAWVVRGWADEALLDSYEEEHRPLAEHNVVRSADELGSRRPNGDEIRVDLAGRIDHRWVKTASGRRSTVDLLGDGLTLLVGPDDAPWRAAAEALVDGPPLAVHGLDPISARVMGVGSEGALLVRPDGVPVACWAAGIEPRAVLADAVAELHGAGALACAA
jgi:2-polyprenyl-6-methoxyphenol hydroxylase-like FAD-dependent oxidoreductase